MKNSIPPVSEWSVKNKGVTLLVNNHSLAQGFKDGISLDVEDDEKGNFIGLGVYDPDLNTCFYWSDWELAHSITLPRFVAHNGRTDLDKLRNWGFKLPDSYLMWDTQIMEHILDSSKRMYGLKKLVHEYFDAYYPSYEELTGKKTSKSHVTLAQLPLDIVSEYNACDCYWTYKLYEKQKLLCM